MKTLDNFVLAVKSIFTAPPESDYAKWYEFAMVAWQAEHGPTEKEFSKWLLFLSYIGNHEYPPRPLANFNFTKALPYPDTTLYEAILYGLMKRKCQLRKKSLQFAIC